MSLHIIDNKRVEMTNDEWVMYQKIVKSYTSVTNNGADLFSDLFEVDEKGVIVMLKPPSKRQTSFEVWLFLMALQSQQHLRVMYGQIADIRQQMQDKMKDLEKKNND